MNCLCIFALTSFVLPPTSGNDLPVHYVRLLAPPLQLFSAAVWQVVQQGLVDHYGMLEEFVTMVTELVPELMSYSQRAQLILGLRARVSIVYRVSIVAGKFSFCFAVEKMMTVVNNVAVNHNPTINVF